MTSSIRPASAHRSYVLRLIKELLAWEKRISCGRFPLVTSDLSDLGTRLMLIERLLTVKTPDLGSLGLPDPLPRPAELMDRSLKLLETQCANLQREAERIGSVDS